MKKLFTIFLLSCFGLYFGTNSANAQNCIADFNYSINSNGVVTFIDSSVVSPPGIVTSWNWYFGDNFTGAGTPQVVHTYQPGTYVACLVITTSTGCSDSICVPITIVNSNCNVVSTIAQSGNVLTAFATGGTPPYTYQWSTGQTGQTLTATSNSLYCVTATDAQGCSSSPSCYLNTNCMAGFVYSLGPNGVVTFFDSSFVSGGQPSSWTWSFGDGFTGSGSQVVHTYQPGTYTVCLYINSSTGCNDSACVDITIPTSGCNIVATVTENNNVLTAFASGGTPPYTYNWSNGQQGPILTVVNAGVYCVNVTDAQGCTTNYCYTFSTGLNCGNFGVMVILDSLNPQLIYASAYGGTAPYQYSWNTFSNTNFDTLTFQGSYCATVIDANGCAATDCYQFTSNPINDAFICGTIFHDVNENGILDSAEGPNWNPPPIFYLSIAGSGLQTSIWLDSLGHFSLPLSAGTYTLTACQTGFNWTFSLPTSSSSTNYCASYTFTIASGDSLCGFNFGLMATSSLICGTVYIDSNNNGTLDSGENGVPYQLVSIGTASTVTNSQGFYQLHVPVGTYPVAFFPNGNYAGYIVNGSNPISVDVSMAGISYCGNNFGIYIPPNSINLSVSINPHSTVTPGFPAYYDIQVCNVGSLPSGATVTMSYDPVLTFNSATIAPANVNAVNHTITWNLPVMQPGACVYNWLNFTASTATVLGSTATNSTIVSPTSGADIVPSNNSDSIVQIAVGSWDPNNKIVSRTNTADPNFHLPFTLSTDQEIRYTVNFQNTGTAPAVNVVVVDEISSELVESSYQFMGTSHNCTVNNTGNTVTYLFSNIMLPDSTNNEPASHGFINYKINAENTLALGDQIIDHAAIYFDFNAPVITNDAIVTISSPLGNPDNTASSLLVFPNPAGDMVRVIAPKAERLVMEIYAADGRLIHSEQSVNGKTSIELSSFSNGMYFIKAYSGSLQWVEKLNVKH